MTPANGHTTRQIGLSLAAILTGLLSVASLAPFSLWLLAFASAGGLFFLIEAHRNSPKIQALYLFLYSSALFGAGASWVYVSIHEFGYASPALSLLLTVLFCFGLAVTNTLLLFAYCHIAKRSSTAFSPQSAILFSVAMILVELSRSWLYSGFPWLLQGYALTQTPLQGVAKVIGVYGASLVIFFCSSVFISGLVDRNFRKGLLSTLCCLAIFAASVALTNSDFSSPKGEAKHVSLVQANISQHDKWRPEWRDRTLPIYSDMTLQTLAKSQLVLWPEASIPKYLDRASTELIALDQRLIAANSALVFGIPSREQKPDAVAVYNSVATLGKAIGIYHKTHLVPFGEYVPFQNILGQLMAFFELPASSMSSGSKNQSPLSVDDWQTSPLVCYEVVFPGLTAGAAKHSGALITLSNDSWFGNSIGPLQHLQMAQMRAIENERYLLRSTGSGVTAIINHNGVITDQLPQFTRAVLQGEFLLREGHTPWTTHGYLLLFCTLGLLTIIALVPLIRR